MPHKIIRLLCTLILVSVSLTANSATVSREDFSRYFKSYFSDPAQMHILASNMGVTEKAKEDIIIKYLRDIMTDDRYINKTYDDLSQMGLLDQPENSEDRNQKRVQTMQYSMYQLTALAHKGLLRLSNAKQRESAEYALNSIRQIREKKQYHFCRAFALRDFSRIGPDHLRALNQLMYGENGTLSLHDLSRTYALNREAVIAELSDNPQPRHLNEQERSLVEQGLTKYFENLADNLSESEIERLGAAFSDLNLASDRDACDVLIIYQEAALSLKGLLGELAVRYLIENE